MLFADDIILAAKANEEVNARLEQWRATLEGKGLQISLSKTEYLQYNFSEEEQLGEPHMTIDEDVVTKNDQV